MKPNKILLVGACIPQEVMTNFLQKIQSKFSKPILFGIYGALGCLIAAVLLGEAFLSFTELPPTVKQTNHAIVLLIDSSSSMRGGKLDEVKSAATDFIRRQDLDRNQLAVVNFGGSTKTIASLTNNSRQLQNAIASIQDSGGTPMSEGIRLAVSELRSTSLKPSILLFTDGQPNSTSRTLSEANAAISQRINLVAVATGGADVNLLSRVTGDRSLVFFANSGEFARAFRDAEAKIYGTQLTESGQSGDYGLIYGSLRTGGWTAILAMGISTILIVGQNLYLRRRFLSFKEAGISVFGGLTAGLIAGVIGQLLFFPVATLPYAREIEGIINWTVATTLLAGLIAFTKSKVDLKPYLIVGGIIGAVAGSIPLLINNDLTPFISAVVVGIGFYSLDRSKSLGWITGIAGIFLGQWLFFPPPGLPSAIALLGRILGWTILGALVGSGTSFFVPNLKLKKALIGGSLGGSLGAIAFLIASSILGDISGRLIGATILGFCIGLMIAWAEKKQLRTEDHLVISWSPQEQKPILLGTRPITLGSSYESDIHLSKALGFDPVTAKIYKDENNSIVMQYDDKYGKNKGMKKLKHFLKTGDKRKLGNITIEVKSSVDAQKNNL